MSDRWYASLYTGLFRDFGELAPRAHDPGTALYSGSPASGGAGAAGPQASGIGWTADAAEAACVGEAIERIQACPLPDDQVIEAAYDGWPLDEPAVAPESWVLFHPEQYTQAGFPFVPFREDTVCRWVCCRRVPTGEPCWVPAEMAYLALRPGERHRICPSYSTGLACGRASDPLVLRGLQEVIERDAAVGAWWRAYPLVEVAFAEMMERFLPDHRARVERPNLRYRCFRIDTPFSAHVGLVTVEGEDREGWCFSIGAACRETRRLAWEKALLEAIHGRHYVRYLKTQPAGEYATPVTFAEHAVYYSRHAEELQRTVLGRVTPTGPADDGPHEDLAALRERLGSARPVLVRLMTPPGLAQPDLDWHVVRVLVPGLQPLHGDHRLPHLGGPLWSPRGLADWAGTPPHPFP